MRILRPWEFSKQEYWSELSCSAPGDLPNPGIQLTSLASPTFAGWFFTTSTTWEDQKITYKESNAKKTQKTKKQSQSLYKHDWGTKKASSQK